MIHSAEGWHSSIMQHYSRSLIVLIGWRNIGKRRKHIVYTECILYHSSYFHLVCGSILFC